MEAEAAVTTLGTMNIVAYTVMAAAYWADSVRYAKMAEDLPPGPKRSLVEDIEKRAENLFRACTAAMATVYLIVLVVCFDPTGDLAGICRLAILVPTGGVLVMCVLYFTGRYIVPINPFQGVDQAAKPAIADEDFESSR